MPNTCTVCMNNSYKKKGISFFTYPKDLDRRNKWLKTVGREDLIGKHGDYRICEEHFEKKFITFSKYRTKKYLSVNAFPSLNFPSNQDASTSAAAPLPQSSPNGSPLLETNRDETTRSVQTDVLDHQDKNIGGKTWSKLIDSDAILNKENSPSYLVCSANFSSDMLKNKRLKPDTVPSVNLPGTLSSYSISEQNAKAPVDKPVIDEIKQEPTSTKEIGTQVENQSILSRQCQCLCHVNTKPLVASIGVQTDAYSAFLDRDSVQNIDNSTEHKDLSQNTFRKSKPPRIINESRRNVQLLMKSKISDVNHRELSAVKRKLSDIYENIQNKPIIYEDSNKICPNNIYTNRNECKISNKSTKVEKKDTKNKLYTNFIEKFHNWKTQLKFKYTGRRYDEELKLFAMNIFFSSPQTYRFLEKTLTLPSIRTLLDMKTIIKPGVDEHLLKLLSTRLKKLSSNHRYCVLCLDEMVLKNRNDEEFYSKRIKVKENAGNAFVIMLKGCIENYKQPLCYTLTATSINYFDLSHWVDDTIRKTFDAGFIVCAIVSNESSNFKNFAKSKGVTNDSPFFHVDEQKIFYLFDVPHIFKNIRNNLLKYNLQYDGNRLACCSHVESFYKREKERNFRFLPMEVHYASQVMSYTVAAGMLTSIELGHLPPEAKDTIDFLIKINNAFDVLNSSKVSHPNKYKRAFHGAGYQKECLREALNTFESIKAIRVTTGKSNTNMISAFSGLKMTINGVLMLFKKLKSEGQHFLFTRRLNQDPLEDFFEALRKQGGNSRDLTPIQFQRAFSKLTLEFLLKKSSVSNCEGDLDVFL